MTNEQFRKTIPVENNDEIRLLLGKFDQHITLLDRYFQVRVIPQGDMLVVEGNREDAEKVGVLFEELLWLLRQGQVPNVPDVEYAIELIRAGQADRLRTLFGDMIFVTPRGKKIKPKTLGQKGYIEAIRKNDIVFGIGPAGTGKTYLAVTMAVKALKERTVQRLILTRPAVEAGESLGYLPGDLQEKVDPYLRPLYDALHDLLGTDVYRTYMEKGIIEIAPLAYMRGRTLDDSFIILDEAQNTTAEQMKMFLTRMGFKSKVIVTGDITQIDLPRGRFSGLAQIEKILTNIEGISFIHLSDQDVVRHPLVQKIIRAYNEHEEGRKQE
ncbi:PhoH family protein [Dethiobacter alkaliphilus]|uniref:PhoH-like protein n=1 Tax=Dethiobacter alkaliphilus AHT 1 TaxID=555088 RepID=C0GEK0_DETAL|nr:PhoH family protein [Dethiobacter alkaliphilus]EEG78032.1 PhoH family protein [Dethiobacter alkaliphilus AHT 1]MCW3489339.1 PhoH family protein [Dethiobacter alkaliphilus]